jgi:hypothetical protein
LNNSILYREAVRYLPAIICIGGYGMDIPKLTTQSAGDVLGAGNQPQQNHSGSTLPDAKDSYTAAEGTGPSRVLNFPSDLKIADPEPGSVESSPVAEQAAPEALEEAGFEEVPQMGLIRRLITAGLMGLTLFGALAATASPAMAAQGRAVANRTVGNFNRNSPGTRFNPGGGAHMNQGGGAHGNRGVYINPGVQRQQQPNFTQQPRYTPQPTYNAGPNHGAHQGGNNFRIPQGGWVTQAHRNHSDLQTFRPNPGWHQNYRNRVVITNNFYDGCWGPQWHQQHWGFYAGNNFWLGFALGNLAMGHNFYEVPIYVMSPMTMVPIGMVQPPNPYSTLDTQSQLQLSVLTAMANPAQDPNAVDYSAGLYQASPYFDANNPGPKLSAQGAFNVLRRGGSVNFHPPYGAFEQLNGLNDLDPYLYARELQQ